MRDAAPLCATDRILLCIETVFCAEQPGVGGVQVGVEKVTLNGRVRMTLKPLMDEMPIVAAIQVGTMSKLVWVVACCMGGHRPSILDHRASGGRPGAVCSTAWRQLVMAAYFGQEQFSSSTKTACKPKQTFHDAWLHAGRFCRDA